MKTKSILSWVCLGMVGGWFAAAAVGEERSTPVRSGKTKIFFYAASQTPASGMVLHKLESGEPIYVSRRPLFGLGSVLSAEPVGEGGKNAGLQLTLTDRALLELEGIAVDRLALMFGGKMIAAPTFRLDTFHGTVTLGSLTPAMHSRLSALLAGTLHGAPVMSLVPRQRQIAPGGTVTVDVFVHGVAGLRSYQVALETRGGRTGRLVRQDMSIDQSRPDFVFGARRLVAPLDRLRGRMGAVPFEGTVDVRQPAYLGTYVFQASPEASGTFEILFRTNEAFLLNADREKIPYRPVNASVVVGSPGRSRFFCGHTVRRRRCG